MNNLKHALIVLIVFFFVAWTKADKVKKVSLYQNQVSIEVPATWQYKEKYRRFSNYQIKYDAQISHMKTKSVLTVDVYDSSHMYKVPIDNELLDSFKEAQINTKGETIRFIERVVEKIDNKDVGLLKFTFENPQGKICYGVQLFFRTSYDNFYQIEVYSLGKAPDEFKKITENIIKSIRFHKTVE